MLFHFFHFRHRLPGSAALIISQNFASCCLACAFKATFFLVFIRFHPPSFSIGLGKTGCGTVEYRQMTRLQSYNPVRFRETWDSRPLRIHRHIFCRAGPCARLLLIGRLIPTKMNKMPYKVNRGNTVFWVKKDCIFLTFFSIKICVGQATAPGCCLWVGTVANPALVRIFFVFPCHLLSASFLLLLRRPANLDHGSLIFGRFNRKRPA